ncbi:hypothetical protein DHEL01_v207832 [Diaporthe helianthi]|uniref:Uncharacterized protein n=1 Tax=Diaporthe helianthi TaxID=158607 RepID=A0A2P5HU45_DIAHE|nr:hypothetical protein DHEL01_v207832 [Diaporthe helianthi]
MHTEDMLRVFLDRLVMHLTGHFGQSSRGGDMTPTFRALCSAVSRGRHRRGNFVFSTWLAVVLETAGARLRLVGVETVESEGARPQFAKFPVMVEFTDKVDRGLTGRFGDCGWDAGRGQAGESAGIRPTFRPAEELRVLWW